MALTFRHKLAVKLIFQIMIVIVIISSGFTILSAMQAREMQKRILDKAQLYSSILGANLDKIIADNLTAYSELHSATAGAAESRDTLEQLRVITKGHMIVSSSVGSEVWSPVEKKYRSMIDDVIRTGTARSIVHSGMGRKTVVHFMPVIISRDKGGQRIGALQISARFPSQQQQLIASVRTDGEAYFRREASEIARELAASLNVFLAETQRNAGYLQRLIRNMKTDEELDNIKIFSRDLGVLFSGEGMAPVQFSAQESNQLQAEAMARQKIIFARKEANGGELLAASPLYLYKGRQKTVAGAVELDFSLKRVKALIRKDRNTILLMNLLIALAFSLLIGWFFKRRIFTPIKELTSLTERIKQDDFSRRTGFKSDDEFGELVKDFNSMMDELDQSRKEIKNWNERLQQKVEQVTEALEKKQKQLLKTEKLASLGILSGGIAHEINNPLGVILGQTQLLLRDVQKRKKTATQRQDEALLASVEENAKRCSHIVKSLLQFTKTKTPHFVATNLHDSIEHALQFCKNRLKEKNIQVTQKLLSEPPMIKADPIQIDQVLINILLNAEQSMEDNGRVRITTYIEEGRGGKPARACVSVQDTGEGIDREHLARIFDPFFSTKEPGEGVGLGLSVSYGIIKAHGGDIEFKSEKGKGTQAIIKLPLKEKG